MKFLKQFSVGLVVFFWLPIALAVDVVAVAPPTYLDGILKWITGASGIASSAVVVIELVLRLVPTAKPLSILVPVKYLFDGMVGILKFLSDLLGQLINSLNVVQPPNP